jgi:2-isopropylmalate synthase
MSAMLDALKKRFQHTANIMDYQEHTLGTQSHSKAITYVQIASEASSNQYFGVAIDNDSSKASLQALMSAFHKLMS